MFSQRSKEDHENFVERLLDAQDTRLKECTHDREVLDQLDEDMTKYLQYRRKLIKQELLSKKESKSKQEFLPNFNFFK